MAKKQRVGVARGPDEIRAEIAHALKHRQVISIVTFGLGESLLEYLNVAIPFFARELQRADLAPALEASVRILVRNALWRNVKQLLFRERVLDPTDPDEHQRINELLLDHYQPETLELFKPRFIRQNLPVTIVINYTSMVIFLKVKNNFALMPLDERDLRRKLAGSATLEEYFLIQEVQGRNPDPEARDAAALLEGIGLHAHQYTVTNEHTTRETIAGLEFPLNANYVPTRARFERQRREVDMQPDKFRVMFAGGDE